MDNSFVQSNNLIYSEAVTCRDVFDTTIAQISSGKRPLKGLQQRFWAWSNNSGVFADPFISLDARLQGHERPQTMVMRLLKLIQKNLEAMIILDSEFRLVTTNDILHDRHESSQIWSEVDRKPTHLEASFFGISGALERLNRLSFLISEASQNTRSVRVEAFMKKAKMDFARFERITNLIISNKYPTIRNSFKLQLTRSIVYRRQSIVYRQHREAMNQQARTNTETTNLDHKNESPRPVETIVKSKQQTPQRQQAQSFFSRPTALDGMEFDRLEAALEQSKTESTASVVAANIRYPRRPRPKDPSAGYADCPFCFKTIGKETFSDLRSWRKHVDSDLMPLVCISEQCTDPAIGFSKYSKWRKHMENEHGVEWVKYIHNPHPIWSNTDRDSDYRHRECPLCRSEAGSLVDERSKSHKENESSEYKASALTEETGPQTATNRRVHFQSELLSDDNKEEVSITDMENDKSTELYALQQKLSRHVADHLRTLCFQTLDVDLDEDEDDDISTHKSGSTKESDGSSDGPNRVSDLSNVSLNFDDDSELSFELEDETDSDDLWESIDKQLIEPPPENGKRYLPLDKLRELIIKPKVRRELKNLEGLDQDIIYRYAHEVCGNTTRLGDIQNTTRKKIFAILVRIEQVQALPSFIDEGLHDVHLPFTLEKGPKWHLTYTTTDKATAQKVTAKYKGSYSWTMAKMSLFIENQWLFMAPFFDMKATKPPFYPFEPRVVLPFLKEEKYDASYGGFSTVSRAHIHEAHHNSEHTGPFAIKKLHSGNRSDFEQERHTMKKLNGQGHPHLMKLLATYKYQDHWYFIFPWANGNLREFWQRYDTPKADYRLAVWIAEQVTGIASGLYLIQHPPKDLGLTQDARDSGRHGDIKPENIVWFKDPNIDESIVGNGVLKIADFGLTRYHHHSSRYVKAQDIQFSLTYKAPEVDVSEEVSQAYDIWTLGCLLLEFVTWYLGGWQAVDEFSADRTSDDLQEIRMDTFYNITVETDAVKRAVLKPTVTNWIEKLHNHEDCSFYFHDLLSYILRHLLQVDPKKRRKCVDVARNLRHMGQRCKDDKTYAICGWIEPPNNADAMETTRTDETTEDDEFIAEFNTQATVAGPKHPSLEQNDAPHDLVALSELSNSIKGHNVHVMPETVSIEDWLKSMTTEPQSVFDIDDETRKSISIGNEEVVGSKRRGSHSADFEDSTMGSKRPRP